MFYARKNGGIVHFVQKYDDTLSLCHREMKFYAKFQPSDLPSGERNFKVCELCRKSL